MVFVKSISLLFAGIDEIIVEEFQQIQFFLRNTL